ncbi:MAG: methylated-DNA--[protein]-cysteine S-methyltransferase [Sphaerochaeta sp.]|nr:methylated-DNA--[protein]-cysteine S-methyltransferase [Sphaerochaeta sp.]MDD3928249.1 methylated-DNA--[protein]-cysteine S-methyltransferase [Sphaerochaeta sp.]NCC12719.1 methylated-DNA--[protein]-cysteine S-methyltransferase [Spirochaetia bacterium]NCC89118.1 methylated-DNA--[protein]-cysteine S-methyltransferase [Spirochaetia bacterium]
MYQITYESPVGNLLLRATASHLLGVGFGESDQQQTCDVLEETKRQLAAYFAGSLQTFTLPLMPEGTPFQQKVWDQLRTIPYGKTVSYADIAHAIGKEKAFRAVGMANNRNPIAIIIPCHRVIGKDGSLTGYAGGMGVKEKLLALEKKQLSLYQ